MEEEVMSRGFWGRIVALSLVVMGMAWAPVAPAADTDVVIQEVFYLGGANQDWVELRNVGVATVDLTGWWSCARFSYEALSDSTILVGDDLMLDPGEVLVLGLAIDLDDTSSDFGIYNTNSFGSSAAMVDFIQWGTATDVGRSDVAAAKGIWRELSTGVYDFIATASANESVSFCGLNGGGGLLTFATDLVNTATSQGSDTAAACGRVFRDGFETGGFDNWDTSPRVPQLEAGGP
jgi:hypothetical protein